MSITMMVSKEAAAGASNVYETTYHGYEGTLYMRETYVGCVVATGEHNYHDDSDFFAIVWSEGSGEFIEVGYASTRGWTYPNSAAVDATPEVLERYNAKNEAARRAYSERLASERAAAAAAEAKKPVKDSWVRVVKGRKVAKGTEGWCIWLGNGDWGERVGIKLADGSVVWTAATNVERVAMPAAPLKKAA